MDIDLEFQKLTNINPNYCLRAGLSYKGKLEDFLRNCTNIPRFSHEKMMYYANNYWIKYHDPDPDERKRIMAVFFQIDISIIKNLSLTIPPNRAVFGPIDNLSDPQIAAYYQKFFYHQYDALIHFIDKIHPKFSQINHKIILEAYGRFLTDKSQNFRIIKEIRASQGKSEPTEFEIFILACLNVLNNPVDEESKTILYQLAGIYFDSKKIKRAA